MPNKIPARKISPNPDQRLSILSVPDELRFFKILAPADSNTG